MVVKSWKKNCSIQDSNRGPLACKSDVIPIHHGAHAKNFQKIFVVTLPLFSGLPDWTKAEMSTFLQMLISLLSINIFSKSFVFLHWLIIYKHWPQSKENTFFLEVSYSIPTYYKYIPSNPLHKVLSRLQKWNCYYICYKPVYNI